MAYVSNRVRYYESSMPGVPQLSGAAGALIAILDACLVNGWGTKNVNTLAVASGVATAHISSGHPFVEGDVIRVAGAVPDSLNGDWRVAASTAGDVSWSVEGLGISDGSATGTITAMYAPAGWEKIFSSGATRAAYRSLDYASHNGLVLYVDDTGTTTARACGYESMSSIDAGTNPFPTAAQLSGGLYWGKAETTTGVRSWSLAADDRRLVFCPAYYSSKSGYAPSWQFGLAIGIAPSDMWATYITGSPSAAEAITNNVANTAARGLLVYQNSSVDDGFYLARSRDGATLSVKGGGRLVGVSTSGTNSLALAALVDPLFGSPAWLFQGTGSAAIPRGMCPGPLHLHVHLPLAVAPGFTKIGSPGNGGVIFRCSEGLAGAWLLDLGVNGRWD